MNRRDEKAILEKCRVICIYAEQCNDYDLELCNHGFVHTMSPFCTRGDCGIASKSDCECVDGNSKLKRRRKRR